MKYRILESFRVKTSQGARELLLGQIITIPHEKALKLLNEGKITPIEKVAYRLYSEILQAYLWVVADDADVKALRVSQNITQPIYTADDIRNLKGMNKEGLKTVHRVKEIFPKSAIAEIFTHVNGSFYVRILSYSIKIGGPINGKQQGSKTLDICRIGEGESIIRTRKVISSDRL